MIALAAISWFKLSRAWFESALALFGATMVCSWLTLPTAIVFTLVMVPNFLFLKWSWGKSSELQLTACAAFIVWPVLLLTLVKSGPLAESLGIAGVVGISYIVFRQIHLIVQLPQVEDGSRLDFVAWLAYVANPFTLLAGPIQNWKDYKNGIDELGRPDRSEVMDALHRIASGLLKVLVLAPIFRGQGDVGALALPAATWFDWLCVLYGYYIFLYLDFSGYTDIVVGSARLVGYKSVPENFNRPYLATNFQDFWGRWHITLGVWFRNHVFNPLFAAMLRRWGSEAQNVAIPVTLAIIFFLIGLWHGIAWNFVLFGIIHAAGVAATFLSRQWLQQRLGKSAMRAYEDNLWLRVIRIVVFQHVVAASFILLNNSVGSIIKLLE